MTFLRVAARALFDILLPPFCIGCKRNGAFFLCARCLNGIEQYRYFLCPVCGKRDVRGRLDKACREQSGLTRFLGAPLPYADPLTRRVVHVFKYQRAKEIALPLSQILIEFLEKNQFTKSVEKYRKRMILAPVPLISFRERERGFNQAAELAARIAARYGIAVRKDILVKRKNTRPQAEVSSHEERRKNIAEAFACNNPAAASGQVVLLVDDVYTSGATMKECARALRKGGAKEVWGITVARG